MPDLPPIAGRPSRAAQNRAYDRQRGSAAKRLYDAAWAKASRLHRQRHPFCRYCEAGAFGPVRTTAATLTDHFYPHRGDRALFWRDEWWVSSCDGCHSGGKQALERQGQAALDRLALRLGLPIQGGIGVQISTTRSLEDRQADKRKF